MPIRGPDCVPFDSCRTAALGGHVMRCENHACGYTAIAYNSCGWAPAYRFLDSGQA